ncbi:MAG: hypothetical protein ACRCYL_11840, partial [Kluyvera sp.]
WRCAYPAYGRVAGLIRRKPPSGVAVTVPEALRLSSLRAGCRPDKAQAAIRRCGDSAGWHYAYPAYGRVVGLIRHKPPSGVAATVPDGTTLIRPTGGL